MGKGVTRFMGSLVDSKSPSDNSKTSGYHPKAKGSECPPAIVVPATVERGYQAPVPYQPYDNYQQDDDERKMRQDDLEKQEFNAKKKEKRSQEVNKKH